MSRSMRNIVVIFVAVLALAVSGSALYAADVASGDQAKEDENRVLAVVGDREITDADIMAVLSALGPQQQMMFGTEYGKGKILEELINKELIYIWAEENNIEETEAFQRDLDNLKRSLMTNHALNMILENVDVTEEEVNTYYEENKKEFTDPEQIKAAHILLEDEETAVSVLEEIKGGEITFEEAAKEYSTGPSAEKGGELGFFSKGQMVPEFEEEAFKLETGELSEPVKTQYGWHLIKVLDRKPAKQKTLDESRGQIYEKLMSEKQLAVYNDLLESLKETYPVKRMETEDKADKVESKDVTEEKTEAETEESK